jgi:pyrroloquinoline quinone (PQQ) biosynthesis protein C
MEQLGILEQTLSLFCKGLESDSPFAKLLEGEADSDLYVGFLIQTYHYVKFTPASLRLAAERLKGHSNPFYESLRERFSEHEAEEEGHDQWVLNDLMSLGQNPDIVQRISPCDAIDAYNAYSKFVVRSSNAVAILGQAFMLEGISQRYGTPMARNLSEKSGIPNARNAVSFLAGHGDADQEHMAELRRVIHSISDERDLDAVVLCAKVVSQLYSSMIDGLAGPSLSGESHIHSGAKRAEQRFSSSRNSA